jgi:hypothetical protein
MASRPPTPLRGEASIMGRGCSVQDGWNWRRVRRWERRLMGVQHGRSPAGVQVLCVNPNMKTPAEVKGERAIGALQESLEISDI